MSQYRKVPSSPISSTPVSGTGMIRGDAALKSWTKNTAMPLSRSRRACPFAYQLWSWDHTDMSARCWTVRASSMHTGNNDVVWMLPCETVTRYSALRASLASFSASNRVTEGSPEGQLRTSLTAYFFSLLFLGGRKPG